MDHVNEKEGHRKGERRMDQIGETNGTQKGWMSRERETRLRHVYICGSEGLSQMGQIFCMNVYVKIGEKFDT